jgi:2-oxoglutarate ferredoxin oxidoreductase subunit gamma
MHEEIVIAGFGGQGVQLMGQLLAKSGMEEEKYVSFLPSYGPEMRGGTTNCNVILSDEPVGSPIVSEPTSAMVLNLPSMTKFEPTVLKDGILIVNSSLIDVRSDRTDIRTFYIPANDIAHDVGNARTANMVMIGAYLALTNAVSVDSFMHCLKEAFGERRAHLLDVNRKAIDAGAAAVKEG